MTFDLAHKYSDAHLIVQPADARLNPPESYLFIQDGLIISCGVLYVLCYFFYMTRTVRDRTLAGPVEYLSSTMAYELFYAFATTSTAFERGCFLMWFMFDLSFVCVALWAAYAPGRRAVVAVRTAAGVVLGLVVFRVLCAWFPDEREQVTAYWTGLVLQFPISWGSLWLLLSRGDTKGHSLEIWITRYLGCYTAYGLFFWRYLNVPENWSYVGSAWSIGLVALTILAETIYPFVYIHVHNKAEQKHKVA